MISGKYHRLKQNSKGTYYIYWQEGSRSRRVSTKETDFSKATTFYNKMMAGIPQESDKLRFVDVISHYMQNHVLEKVVDKKRQAVIANHIILAIGGVEIENEKDAVEAIDKYRRERMKIVKSSTVRREMNMLQAAIKYSVEKKRLDRSLEPEIDLPEEGPSKDVWLNEEQSKQFLECATGRIHMFCLIALETGARKESIKAINGNKIDLLSKIIDFSNGIQTNKRRGKVPMSNVLYEALLRYTCGGFYEGPLFGGWPNFYRDFESVVEKFISKTGWTGGRITPHTLRHTWATQAARAGIPIWQVAGVLGDTIATVSKVYAHHCPDHLREAVNFRDKKN